jgi:phosphoribosylanthranilate isomerase
MSEQQPSEEEMRAALEEQMRHIRVEDVILQTVVTLINLGARRLGLTGSPEEAGERDPEQARLAIEGARGLIGLVDSEDIKPIRDALSQLQMAYVQATGGQAPAEQQESAEEAERAKARSKLWTPGDS